MMSFGKNPGYAVLIEKTGNLFDALVEALVNAVNCEGVMGKGLALAFKTRFPEMFASYREACRQNELRPGGLHTFRSPGEPWVINFPTKNHWRNPSRLEYIEAALPRLVTCVQNHGIRSIAIPALGCGLGGLDWNQVKPRIEAAFRPIEHNVDIWLFGPK